MSKLRDRFSQLRDKTIEVRAVIDVVKDLVIRAEAGVDDKTALWVRRWVNKPPADRWFEEFTPSAIDALDAVERSVNQAKDALTQRLLHIDDILAADNEAEMRRRAREHFIAHFAADSAGDGDGDDDGDGVGDGAGRRLSHPAI